MERAESHHRVVRRMAGLLVVALGVLLPLVAVAGDFDGAPQRNIPDFSPNRVVLTMAGGTSDPSIERICAEYGAKVVYRGRYCPAVVIELPGSGEPAKAFVANGSQVRQKYPSIQTMDRSRIARFFDTPNDEFYPPPPRWDPNNPSYYGWQWQLQPDPDSTKGYKHIYAPEAWDLQKGSKNVIVAVIDSGVRTANRYTEDDPPLLDRRPHPDLAGRLLYGYDFADMPDNDDDNPGPQPTEEDYIGAAGDRAHGTHVAGIIAAQGNNSMGICGLCWDNVWILPLKVCTDSGGIIYDYAIADAISYCVGYNTTYQGSEPFGVGVINLSLGWYGSGVPIVQNALREAAKRGIIVCAAAGNYGIPAPTTYPATYEEAICVGASEQRDLIADFSNRGRAVDIVAPGSSIYSTIYSKEAAKEGDELAAAIAAWDPDNPTWPDPQGNTFASMSGTSMASPHVAAAAALLLSHGVPPGDVKELLYSTATPKGLGYPNETYGWGVLNVYGALKKASIDAKIESPAKGSVVPTRHPRIRIDFRHAKKDTIKVWIDNISDTDTPVLDGANPAVFDRYYYTLDEKAHKTYLRFDYQLSPGTHTIRVKADTDMTFTLTPPEPLIVDTTSSFTVAPQTLGRGWHLFAVPFKFSEPITPQEFFGTTVGVLARWHYANNRYGQYAMYTFDGSRTDPEATFDPPSVVDVEGRLSEKLVHQASDPNTATPPAGLGYWVYLNNPIEYPESTGQAVDGQPYEIGLYYGWNMVGNPFPFPVDWASTVVEYAGKRVPAAEAAARGWLSDFIFRYEPVYGKYTWKHVGAAVMMPWEAEWAKVRVRGPNGWPEPDVKLIIPPNPYTGAVQ